MAAPRSPPQEPLVVVLGSTGTGKSDLAVELATRFNGEIINTDAMQIYKGLPIVTNKITVPERRGIPHHLLDHTALDDTPWSLNDFKIAANKVIREIRSRGNLPIIVGGTHYYTNSLLFQDITVGSGQEEPRPSFPILSEPPEVILAKLKEVDPAMAARWHPNDHRKILRSLEIYLKYGRPASEIYAEQKLKKTRDVPAIEGLDDAPWQSLLFWVHSETEVLRDRLDKRIDKMLDTGLMDEVVEMYEHVKAKEAQGEPVPFDKGIWQSIGFKEFQPYLRAVDAADPAADQLKAASLEAMKISTRQYATAQIRWIRSKTVTLLQDHPGAMDHLFVVDSTDVSQWGRNVAEPAVAITRQFLGGESLPSPVSLSASAKQVLEAATTPLAERTVCQKTCEVCNITTVTMELWEKHLKGKKHKARLRGRAKRALVPIAVAEDTPALRAGPVASRSPSPDVELGGIFDLQHG